jgi:hypothetical protein
MAALGVEIRITKLPWSFLSNILERSASFGSLERDKERVINEHASLCAAISHRVVIGSRGRI